MTIFDLITGVQHGHFAWTWATAVEYTAVYNVGGAKLPDKPSWRTELSKAGEAGEPQPSWLQGGVFSNNLELNIAIKGHGIA